MRENDDYTTCPECGRKTVMFHYGIKGHDYLQCGRYDCLWETYRWDETDELQRWKDRNPSTDDKQ